MAEPVKIKYRTYFGNCPSRSAGTLTMRLVKIFEQEESLRSLKQEIIREKLSDKYFISNYRITYDPIKKFLVLKFECPEPLMKVQVYKDGGMDTYSAILVENGELYDPVYEMLLRNEKKLTRELPYLALPVGEMEKSIQYRIAKLIKTVGQDVKSRLAEVILSDSGELTIIMSYKGHPSSIFIGKNNWKEKMDKLHKIILYMQKKEKIPSIINLTNAKKVVVKFSDKF